MLIDALLQFDPSGTAITVTAASTNVLDMVNPRDMAIGGRDLDILVLVQQAFTAAGAATLVAALQTAPDNAGVPGTWSDQIVTPAIGKAALVIGTEILRTPLPYQQLAQANIKPRFYRLNYTVATGPMTAGTVFAGLVEQQNRQNSVAYPANYDVSQI